MNEKEKEKLCSVLSNKKYHVFWMNGTGFTCMVMSVTGNFVDLVNGACLHIDRVKVDEFIVAQNLTYFV